VKSLSVELQTIEVKSRWQPRFPVHLEGAVLECIRPVRNNNAGITDVREAIRIDLRRRLR
jgi:hypothetical protein